MFLLFQTRLRASLSPWQQLQKRRKTTTERRTTTAEKKISLLRFVHANDSPFSVDAFSYWMLTESKIYLLSMTLKNICRWKWKCTHFSRFPIFFFPVSIHLFIYVCVDCSACVRESTRGKQWVPPPCANAQNFVLMAMIILAMELKEICPWMSFTIVLISRYRTSTRLRCQIIYVSWFSFMADRCRLAFDVFVEIVFEASSQSQSRRASKSRTRYGVVCRNGVIDPFCRTNIVI